MKEITHDIIKNLFGSGTDLVDQFKRMEAHQQNTGCRLNNLCDTCKEMRELDRKFIKAMEGIKE